MKQTHKQTNPDNITKFYHAWKDIIDLFDNLQQWLGKKQIKKLKDKE